MREHMGLSRGKRTDNGEWVEGYLIEQNVPEYYCYIVVSFRAEQDNRHTDILECDIYEVDPDTVGECTGLRDKNDKLIFEGDIVLDADEPCKIVFENCCWKEIFQGDMWSFIYDDDEFEIIGNVADNPELLKGGEGDG